MCEDNKKVVLGSVAAMGRVDSKTAANSIVADAFTLAKGIGKFAGVRKHDTIVAIISALQESMPDGMRLSSKVLSQNRIEWLLSLKVMVSFSLERNTA